MFNDHARLDVSQVCAGQPVTTYVAPHHGLGLWQHYLVLSSHAVASHWLVVLALLAVLALNAQVTVIKGRHRA